MSIAVVNNAEEQLNINCLNNDCLINIFEYVSIQERLKLELVCRRWNEVAKLSWNSTKFFNLCLQVPVFKTHDVTEKEIKINTNFLINVFSRCSFYLDKLHFDLQYGLYDFSRIINVLPKQCPNLNSLVLEDVKNGDKNITCEHLDSLFRKTVNLHSICLRELSVTGDFYSKIRADYITVFFITNCEFKLDFYLRLLVNMNNLIKFSIQNEFTQVIMALSALTYSKCENLTYLSIDIDIPIANITVISQLTDFIFKQIKLSILSLRHIKHNVNMIKMLPNEYLKKLTLDCFYVEHNCNNPIYPFDRFEKLEEFTCYVYEENIKFLQGINSAISLKELNFIFKSDSNIRFDYFDKLQNLQICYISHRHKSIDNILNSLIYCKNLKDLTIENSCLTEPGLKSIGLLKNVSLLTILASDIKDDGIGYLVEKLLKLEILTLMFCKHLTSESIKIASDKKSKNETHILKIRYINNVENKFKNEFEDLSPFLKVRV